MLQFKKLKSLNIAQISFVISVIVYQEVGCKYFNISCRLENIKKKILIDAHTNTEHRIYWSPRKWQNFLNFLQGVSATLITSLLWHWTSHRRRTLLGLRYNAQHPSPKWTHGELRLSGLRWTSLVPPKIKEWTSHGELNLLVVVDALPHKKWKNELLMEHLDFGFWWTPPLFQMKK